MKTLTVREAQGSLEDVVNAVVDQDEEVILVTEQGEQAVSISVPKYQAMLEVKRQFSKT